MDLKNTYNKIAPDWFKDHQEDMWWQEGTDAFLAQLPPGASILDIGCGAGVKSRYLAEKGFKVTGADFSEKMIELAKENSTGIEFRVADLYELEKIPETFDAVFAQASLLHISKERIREVLGKIKDRINPQGFLYVAVKGVREDRVEEEVRKENDYGYEYERFFSYYSVAELEGYLKELEVTIIWKDIKKVGKTEWIQVVGRKGV